MKTLYSQVRKLADIYADTGRKKEAKKIREQIASDDFPEEFFDDDDDDIGDEGEECLEICGDGNVLRLKTILNFGEKGVPLDKLSGIADGLRKDKHLPEAGKAKAGRNEPCPCGSGKKFKKCCGK